MNENDIYTILQKDDNLREAIRRREQKQSTMPADLNDRLMKRLEATPNPIPGLCPPTRSLSPREGRTKSLRWLAAAACLLIIIGIGVALMPSKENPSSGEFAIRQGGVGDLKSPEAIKNHRIANPNTQDSRITNSTEPKAMAVAESKTVIKTAACEEKSLTPPLHGRGETVRNKWGTTILNTKATAPKQEPLITHEAPAAQAPQSDNYIAVTETPHQQPELKPTVLTERDIPITRPENYRYTSEDLALMKEQAQKAYVKRVQLELEISKCNLEQMKQQ